MPGQDLQRVGAGLAVDREHHHGFAGIDPLRSRGGGVELGLVDGRDAVLGRAAGLNLGHFDDSLVEIRVRPLKGVGQLGVYQVLDRPPRDRSNNSNADDAEMPAIGSEKRLHGILPPAGT